MSRGKANSGDKGGAGSSKTNTPRTAGPGPKAMDDDRDEANKRRFVAPAGVEASDLPDGGRPTGYNDTPVDIGRRNLPQQHGGAMPDQTDDMTAEDDGGLRGDRAFTEEPEMNGGGRGKN